MPTYFKIILEQCLTFMLYIEESIINFILAFVKLYLKVYMFLVIAQIKQLTGFSKLIFKLYEDFAS